MLKISMADTVTGEHLASRKRRSDVESPTLQGEVSQPVWSVNEPGAQSPLLDVYTASLLPARPPHQRSLLFPLGVNEILALPRPQAPNQGVTLLCSFTLLPTSRVSWTCPRGVSFHPPNSVCVQTLITTCLDYCSGLRNYLPTSGHTF